VAEKASLSGENSLYRDLTSRVSPGVRLQQQQRQLLNGRVLVGGGGGDSLDTVDTADNAIQFSSCQPGTKRGRVGTLGECHRIRS
jgi:hypothetical protein